MEYELRITLFPIYCRLMAAIFDLRHTQILEGIPFCLSVLPDSENMGIAVEIALLLIIINYY